MNDGLAAMAGRPRYVVEYIIDGKQPVQSTIIGDEPRFCGADNVDEQRVCGKAFCETCASLQDFYVEIDIEFSCDEQYRHQTEFICKNCEMQLLMIFSPNGDP